MPPHPGCQGPEKGFEGFAVAHRPVSLGCLFQGEGVVKSPFQHGASAVAAGEVADLGDALVAERLGGQHGEEAHGAAADNGDGVARRDPGQVGGVVVGAVDVGGGEQCPR